MSENIKSNDKFHYYKAIQHPTPYGQVPPNNVFAMSMRVPAAT